MISAVPPAALGVRLAPSTEGVGVGQGAVALAVVIKRGLWPRCRERS